MDEYLNVSQKKDQKFWLWFSIIGFVVAIIIVITGLTTFETEVLTCSVKEDDCSVEKTNMFGMKFNKNIAKYSEIKEAGYRKERVKGNRYAKGYTALILTFKKENNFTVDVFSGIYFESAGISKDIIFLNKKIREKEDILLEKKNLN